MKENKSWSEELIEKYPTILKSCGGIGCGEGWKKIIISICEKIDAYNKTYAVYLTATQVKEKFGTLRFYTNYYVEEIDNFISDCEEQTSHICEICGNENAVDYPKGGYHRTWCESCIRKEKINEKLKML